MAKRFKTKQEFSWRTLNGWVHDMNHLFGLPWNGERKGPFYPELCDKEWSVREEYTTENPHPYDGRVIKIRVTPEQSEMVQKKAFALGYKWRGDEGGNEIEFKHAKCLFFHKEKAIWMTVGDSSFDGNSATELTVQQFMDGDKLPDGNRKKACKGCPYGHVLGEGFEHYDDCVECYEDIWDECLFLSGENKKRDSKPEFKQQKQKQDGKAVQVQGITPSITGGQRKRGSSVSGRRGRTAISSRPVIYEAVTG